MNHQGQEDIAVDYRLLNEQLAALIADEPDALANSANFVGLLYAGIPDINWLGMYVFRAPDLVLGPYQGNPACVRIRLGSGVCGTAAEKQKTVRVANVHDFDGHIACDPASVSEIVVPLLMHGRLVGVLDIDSPLASRFDETDQRGIEMLCSTLLRHLEQKVRGADDFI